MLPSIGASTVDLFIVVSNDIKVVQAKLILIYSKYLYYYDVIRSSSYLSRTSRLILNSILLKGTRSRTRPNRSYMKPYMYRSPNSSLLKGGRRWGGRPEEVSSVRHLGCRYRLLIF